MQNVIQIREFITCTKEDKKRLHKNKLLLRAHSQNVR